MSIPFTFEHQIGAGDTLYIGNELRSALNQEWTGRGGGGGGGGDMAGTGLGARPGMITLPPMPPVEPYGVQALPPHARAGPMFYDYRYDPHAPTRQQQQQQQQGEQPGAVYHPDSITVVNAFEGDFPDRHASTSDVVANIGVRGRTVGAPAGGGGYNRGYGASGSRAGVNSSSRYPGTATGTGAGTAGAITNTGAGAGARRTAAGAGASSRPPTANALSRAASAANRQPRKVMNYAAGFKEEQGK